ncbi:NADH:ubiquinone oxidoreductase subunit NDUFA12 [Shimia sp. MIT1388]|uniref:NADH:ubiquinone oxidoreductase subunit NDUFA12 n=1 Tax=Shimia sp. MIT1388 TaxID=3096992 RepID=UPI00399AA6DB
MGILSTINNVLTWWNGGTLNTKLFTMRKGVKMGEDEQGNVYYRTENDSKRWVIFNGEVEASRVSADWHGWLHRTFDEVPSQKPLKHKEWEIPHQENVTGTALAYAPAGTIRAHGKAPVERSDYEAWSPE